MLKFLILVGLIIWLYHSPAVKKLLGKQARPSAKPRTQETEQMLRCAHCDVHLPASEAHRDGEGRPYCSKEHLASGPGH